MIKEIGSQEWESDRYGKGARPWIRLLALAIDGVVFIPVLVLSWGLQYLMNFNLPNEIINFLFALYLILFHWKKGKTIGKKQTELRVETLEGNRISFKQSLIRTSIFIGYLLLLWISSMQEFLTVSETISDSNGIEITINRPAIFWIVYLDLFAFGLIFIDVLWMFTNKEKRALHDLLAGTICREK